MEPLHTLGLSVIDSQGQNWLADRSFGGFEQLRQDNDVVSFVVIAWGIQRHRLLLIGSRIRHEPEIR